LASFGFEDCRIEFRAGKKRQHDGACPRQEGDPLGISGQAALRKTEYPR
jgi:hypothetical protein